MIEIVEKEKCTGCTACKSICPKNAIIMKDNDEGFLYPSIDQDKCIDCNLCKKTCPVLKDIKNNQPIECYAAYAKDEEILMKSSSGGLFTIFANYILEQGGIVIGAAFDENMKLNHIAITSKEDLYRLQGSKYLQSNLNNIFLFVKENINNKKILFVGTPCQVAGLRSFIDHENLYCADLICHGVPSPKLFDKYVKELEDKNGRVMDIKFRDKSTGWYKFSVKTCYKNKRNIESQKKNSYFSLFMSNIVLRESCYKCNFKIDNTYADITIGDFWGIKRKIKHFFNDKGVSAVLINTSKGNNLLSECIDKMKYTECNFDEIVSGNHCLLKSVEKPKTRDEFFNQLDTEKVSILYVRYKNNNNYIRIITKTIKETLFRK